MNNHLIYLNTAGTGLLAPSAVEASEKFYKAALADPSNAFLTWMEKDLPETRKNAAALLQADESQIAFAPNFSFALLSVIQSLQSRIKKVLLYKTDYPSLNLPFELGDFNLHYIDSPDGFHISTDEIIHLIDKEKIEAVALSHVQFLSGFKTDIETVGAYCRKKGVVFIVDATQSMGALPLHFRQLPVDVLISSSYKWLNGGFGSALLCIKESFIQRFPPRVAGFGSMNKSGGQWEYKPSNKSFEPGHLNAPALLQLQEGIRHKLQTGVAAINKHNSHLLQKLQDGLLDSPYKVTGGNDMEHRLHILCFEAGQKTADHLKKEGFAFTWRKESIRISPHFYNTDADIEALLTALKEKR